MARRDVAELLPDRDAERGFALVFPKEVRALQTPFRSHALHLMYGTALSELGKRMRSATVSTWSEPGEADSEILLLGILADADVTRLDTVRESMLTSISKEAAGWTEEERQDYSRHIYFELEPLQA